jgi:hypothetical protein
MKIAKMMMVALLTLPCNMKASDKLVQQAMEGLVANVNVQNLVVALSAGVAHQLVDVSKGQDKTLNPFFVEMREATEKYSSSMAAGFRLAGASVHLKVPGAFDLAHARANFSPFIAIDCAPGSDKALLNRTDADKQPVLSVRAGLSETCKIEARCNVSNALWAAGSVAALVAGQMIIAAASSK